MSTKIRTKRGTFSLALALVMALVFGTVTASAAEVTPRRGPYYLAEGIGHVDYYIGTNIQNSEYYSTFVNLINNAANSWVVTGYGYNSLYMYRTYDFNASNMDIDISVNLAGGYVRGDTIYWDVTSSGHEVTWPTTSFWDYCQIFIYTNMHDMSDTTSIQQTIAHEMGHGFGLDDNDTNPNSVMCSWQLGCAVYKPGKADHDGLNAMYGN